LGTLHIAEYSDIFSNKNLQLHRFGDFGLNW
jgi:hypothetical protein